MLLGALGFFIIAILAARNIHAAILISIVITTVIGLILGDVQYQGIFAMPPSITTVVGKVDIVGALDIGLSGVIFAFMLVNLFDSSGTLIGVTDKAGLTDEKGKFPRMKQALYVDSLSSVAGSAMGTSSVTAFIESTSRGFSRWTYRFNCGCCGYSFLTCYFLITTCRYGAKLRNGWCINLCGCINDLKPYTREMG